MTKIELNLPLMINRHFTRFLVLSVAFSFCFGINILKSQIVINEIQTSNLYDLHDEYYKYNDWIELYNAGSSSVNLNGYGLSDDSTKQYTFRFPDHNLAAGGYVIVLAGDTNKTNINTHWETAVKANDSWKYRNNTTSPGTISWTNLNFDDASWSSGTGGIGNGDSDDGTTVSASPSIYMRKTFNIPDTSKIQEAVFNMDFDDGYVAYLNGVEIARVNIGTQGIAPAWNQLSPAAFEAMLYQNKAPDSIHLDKKLIRALLRNGNNVLAVETHNQTTTTSDLTSNPYLTFSIDNGTTYFGNPPSWFHAPPVQYYHAKFKLNSTGETVYLYNNSGYLVDKKATGFVGTDNSIGRNPDGSNSWCLSQIATPGTSNNSSGCATGYATPPIFSLAPGFYSSSKTLSLSTSLPGGVIRYTKDGSDVTASSSQYTTPITISNTQTIKASVFGTSVLQSPTITQSYFINFDCKLPVYCLTTDPKNLTDYNTGIFVDGPDAQTANPHWGANYWKEMEKPISLEYFERNKSLAFQFNASVEITGGWSRADPQKSLEIKIGDKFGLSNLNYSLVSAKPWLDKWDDFILSAMGQDKAKCRMRDAMMNRILESTNCDWMGEEPCLLMINGQSWGVYYVRENDDNHFVTTEYGYKSDEMDLLKESYFYPGMEVKKGSDSAFFKMYEYATTVSPTDADFYSTISSMMDLDNMADYFIGETFYPNNDWMGGGNNNLKMWRPRKPDGKFRYITYDLDFGLGLNGSSSDNVLSTALNASPHNHNSDLFKKFTQNPTFKRYFINRYADLINTIFLPSNIQNVTYMFRDTLRHDIHYQNEKWGGPDSTTWKSNIASMMTFAGQRPATVRNQIQSSFSMTSQVTLTLQVSPAGAGRIQISTISPETYPWNGVYFNGNPVTITAIPNPGYTFDHWRSNTVINSNNVNQSVTYNFTSSDVITCYFTGSATAANIKFTEVNYNSDTLNNPGDWVELHNAGSTAIDISNWELRDEADNHRFRFPVTTTIPANGYLVLASDLEKFQAVFPSVTNVIGSFRFDLSNSSEAIRIYDSENSLYTSMTYADYLPWPQQADGHGYTLERQSLSQSADDGTNWFAGCLLGSPGRAYTASAVNVSTQGGGTYCNGSSAQLDASAQAGSTYQWQLNSNNISGAVQSNLNVTQSGVYRVLVTNSGCSVLSDTINIHFISAGNILSTTPASRCSSGTVTLSASGTSTLNWYDVPSGGSSLQSGNSFVTPSISQTTTFYVESSGPCPSSRVPVVATINPTLASPVVNDVSRCGPGQITLNASGVATIYWYDSMTGGTLLDSGATFDTPILSQNAIYYAQAGKTCVGPRSDVNAIINSITPDPVASNVSRCGTGTVTLNANTNTVKWYDAQGGNLLYTGNHFTTPSLSLSTFYYLQDGTACPSDFIAVQAIINEITPDPVVSDVNRCGPGSVNLFANSSDDVNWYDVQGGNLLFSGSTLSIPLVTTTTTFYAIAGNVCPSNYVPVTAIINSITPDPVVSDVARCGPGAVNFTSSSLGNLQWFDTPGGSIIATGDNMITPVLNANTTFWVSAGDICPSNLVPVNAIINPLPVVNLGNDTMISSGSSIVLDAGNGYSNYLWNTQAQTQTILVNSSGTFSVTVTDVNGCQADDDIVVNLSTGISYFSEKNISIFPNPAKDKCNLYLPSTSSTWNIKLMDATGKILLNREVKSGLNEIGIQNYAAGIYYLNVRNENSLKTIKLFVD